MQRLIRQIIFLIILILLVFFILNFLQNITFFPNFNFSKILGLAIEEEAKQTQLVAMNGPVKLIRNQQQSMIEAGQSQVVINGDQIQTQNNSKAMIDYGQGTVARLAENTTIVYHDPVGTGQSLTQIIGSVYLRFQLILGIREEFMIETPTATAAVRGTTLTVIVSQDLISEVIAYDHQVEVYQKDQAKQIRLDQSKKILSQNTVAQIKPLTQESPVQAEKLVEIKKYDPDETAQSWLKYNQIEDQKLEIKLNNEATIKEEKSLIDRPIKTINSFFQSLNLKATPTPTPVIYQLEFSEIELKTMTDLSITPTPANIKVIRSDTLKIQIPSPTPTPIPTPTPSISKLLIIKNNDYLIK